MAHRSSRKDPIRDQFDVLQQQINNLRKRIEVLENNRRPSFPIYDSENFPQVAQEGEVCIAPTV